LQIYVKSAAITEVEVRLSNCIIAEKIFIGKILLRMQAHQVPPESALFGI